MKHQGKRVLFVQHDHVSPIGAVGERFEMHGFDIVETLVVPESSFAAPNVHFDFGKLDDFDVFVPLGAPWGAWDDACIGNWLQPEIEWVRALVSADKPVLGICFGGQLVARAMGGSVAPAPRGEIGYTAIFSSEPELVSNGPWFQFHYDRWQLPPEAVEVARNALASQAFKIKRTLAVQFHPELNSAGLKGWLDNGGDAKVIADGQDPAVLLETAQSEDTASRLRTFALVDAFLDQVALL